MSLEFPRPKKSFPQATRGGGFQFEQEEERPLEGVVNNLKAAQGEERLVRSVRKGIEKKKVRGFLFRTTLGYPRGMTGSKELDLLVIGYGRNYAISVKDLSFVHANAADKAQDKLNEVILLQRLRNAGYDTDRIISVDAARLGNQANADKVAKEIGIT